MVRSSASTNPFRAVACLFRAFSFGRRFRQARHRPAIIAAGIYWCSILGSYAWAAIVRDETGLAFLPFTCLALPWSLLMSFVAAQIPSHGFAAVAYAILCFVFSGVNALVLYLLIVAGSTLIEKLAGLRSR